MVFARTQQTNVIIIVTLEKQCPVFPVLIKIAGKAKIVLKDQNMAIPLRQSVADDFKETL